MKIRDIMENEVVTLQSDASLYEAAVKMQHHDVGALPVVTPESHLMGIVTDRDLVVRGLALGHAPHQATVDQLMTHDVITVEPEDEAEQALRVMSEGQIRRVPVLDHGMLVGMVSLGDFAQHRLTNSRAGEALSRISSPR